jgi:hypothetical protein
MKVGWIFGLAFGIVGGLVFGLFGGLVFGELERTSFPNQGVRRSARNGVRLGLVVGIVVGLTFGLVGGLGDRRQLSLFVGPVVGLAFGLVAGLQAGGEACLRHLVLRLWLILNGSTPPNYVVLLDHAAERLLLRKVGGGYAFIHRSLLKYFAARYEEPSSGYAKPTTPSSTRDELQTA